MTPTASPAPRLLIVLVAAIVLAGVPVAAIGGIGLIVYPPYAGTGALLAIAAFSARLREEVDIATVTTDLHATVRDAVNPSSWGLWIREARP